MNRRSDWIMRTFFLGVVLAGFVASGASAEKLPLKKTLDASEARCLSQLFHVSDWRFVPQFEEKGMLENAKVGHADLNVNAQRTMST